MKTNKEEIKKKNDAHLRLCNHVYHHNIWSIIFEMLSAVFLTSVITLISLVPSPDLILKKNNTARPSAFHTRSGQTSCSTGLINILAVLTHVSEKQHPFYIFLFPSATWPPSFPVGWLVFKGVAGCYGDTGIRKCKCQLS